MDSIPTHTLQVMALGIGAFTTGVMACNKSHRGFLFAYTLLNAANVTFLLKNNSKH